MRTHPEGASLAHQLSLALVLFGAVLPALCHADSLAENPFGTRHPRKQQRLRLAVFLTLVLLLALPMALQAQFTYTTNNAAITITGYTWSGGDVTIPSTINGLPVTCIGTNAFYCRSALTSVTIPDSVTTIENYAFSYCSSLTNIMIPNSVARLGSDAFSYCTRLTNITIGAGVSYIGDQAFQSCSSLSSVTIPDSVVSLGDYVFSLCTRLTSVTLPNSVTNVGSYAFSFCTGLTNITIPSSVTRLGDYAFYYSTNLASLTVDPLNSAYSSVAGVLFNKSQTILIQCPANITGHYVVPDSVTNIGNYAFLACAKLTGTTMGSGVTSIGQRAFQSCSGLTDITIGSGVTTIGSGAFWFCTSLTNILLPSSVTSIEDQAFNVMGTNLLTIIVDAANGHYSSVDGVLFDKSQSTLIQCPGGKAGKYSIPSSVTSIGDYAFCDCARLTSVTIPHSVTNIATRAFNYCFGLTNVTIPDSVTSIEFAAFESCSNLTVITIGSGLTEIGGYAFYDCPKLTDIYFQGNAPSVTPSAFSTKTTLYYLPGTTGWSNPFAGHPAKLWNPVAQASGPNFGVRANRFGFTITGTADIPIVVEACIDLTKPVWQSLQTCTLTNGSVYFSDPAWNSYSTRIYRLRSP